MATILEFQEIRELILKNAILNKILVASISNKIEYVVGSTLQKLRPDTKEILRKDVNRKNLPTYALYDIYVAVTESGYSIGIKYQNHPIIFEYRDIILKNRHDLAETIYNHYSLNPAKSDKIFSNISTDIKGYLEENEFSSNFWRLGFSKKLNKSKYKQIESENVSQYLTELKIRNNEYRAFNKILISIQKRGTFYAEHLNCGSITVVRSIFNDKFIVSFDSNYDWKVYDDIIPIYAFTPTLWNTIDSNIDKWVLSTIIK